MSDKHELGGLAPRTFLNHASDTHVAVPKSFGDLGQNTRFIDSLKKQIVRGVRLPDLLYPFISVTGTTEKTASTGA